MKTSKRDIRPKFGQTFFFQYEHTPFGGDYYGEILSLQAQLYFPGLFKHHSLKGRIGLQTQDMSSDADSYRFSSPIPFTRGYVYEPFQTFLTTSTDYALPVWYADLNILSLLNIQRIRANMFHDYGYGIVEEVSTGFHSTGIELMFDFNVMRYRDLFNVGVRYVYTELDRGHNFQLMIGNIGIF